MNDQIAEFLIILVRLLAYAAVIAILAIGLLAVFGRDADWSRTYGIALVIVGSRTLIFGPDWLR